MRGVYCDGDLVTKSFYDMNQYLREKRIAEVINHIAWHPRDVQNRSLLDVGCGEGESAALIAKAVHFSFITAIDNDPKLIEKANTLYPNISFRCAEVHEMSTKYKTIHCGHVIEHVEKPVKFLRDCHSHLLRDGRIIVTTPNARSLHKCIGDRMGISEPYELSHTDNEQEHKHVFDMPLLEAFLRMAQFKVVHKQGLMLKPFPSSMMWDLLDVKMMDAFWEVGRDPKLMDYCSSIMIVGEKRP